MVPSCCMRERCLSKSTPLITYQSDPTHRSTIRITLENVSSLPIDFLRLIFDDSTIAPAQQALTEGDLSVFDTYETEYDLIHRPMFSWNREEAKDIAPGQKLTLTITCLGKVGWWVRLLLFSAWSLMASVQHNWRDPRILFLRTPPTDRSSNSIRSLPHPPVVVSCDGHRLPNARVSRNGYPLLSLLHLQT